MIFRSSTRRRHASRIGSLTIEIAICLPILMLFLLACYETARANMILHATESAAYEAARVGIVPGAKEEDIKNAAGFILGSVGIQEFSVAVTPKKIKTDTRKVKVEVTVPFRANMPLPKAFINDPRFLGTCELNREVL